MHPRRKVGCSGILIALICQNKGRPSGRFLFCDQGLEAPYRKSPCGAFVGAGERRCGTGAARSASRPHAKRRVPLPAPKQRPPHGAVFVLRSGTRSPVSQKPLWGFCRGRGAPLPLAPMSPILSFSATESSLIFKTSRPLNSSRTCLALTISRIIFLRVSCGYD